MPPARPQAAKQQKAALNVGTAASKGGGTGSAQQHKAPQNIGTAASQGGGTGSPKQKKHKAAPKIGTSASHGGGTGSPSPSKRGPPRDRQSPAIDETRLASQKKQKKTKPDTADFATVTPILQSETAGEMESVAGEDESGNAVKDNASKDDATVTPIVTPILQSGTAGEMESAAGEDDSGNAGKDNAGKDGEDESGNANISSPDFDDDITNQTKPSISKTILDGESSDDDDTDTSGNSYHLIIFI